MNNPFLVSYGYASGTLVADKHGDILLDCGDGIYMRVPVVPYDANNPLPFESASSEKRV